MQEWKLLVVTLTMVVLAACTTTQGSGKKDPAAQTPAEVNTQLGIEYMRNDLPEAALEKLTKALKQDPDYQLAHISIAVLYEQLEDNALAEKHYRKAYALDRSDPVMLNSYGQFLCSKGDFDEADRMFMKAVRDPIYQNPDMVYTNAGICADRQGDSDQAEKYFRQALQKNPYYRPALGRMILMSFEQNNYLATRAYLQRLQEQVSLSPEHLWVGVRAEAELGDQDAAASYALLLKNRFPESEQAQALQAWERKRRER